MAAYLQGILAGDVDLDAVKLWIAGGTGLPPLPATVGSPQSPPISNGLRDTTAEQLRALALNYVKEQADVLFLASEKQAAEANSDAQLAQSKHGSRVPWPADHKRASTPGLVTEHSFPSLSVKSGKVW